MMSGDITKFFDEICVRLGLCLSMAARSRLALGRFRDEDAFELAVLEAENLDPLKVDRRLRDELRHTIDRYW
ncbi:MAG TPA: hypothetical protein VK929_17015 [Longimicrobiales bacterium]|nr:hypothetical protein [Longimicrobiales bacterium]